MSNKKINLKELIVSKALEMYNAYGVEYVGVRELAKELEIKGGNITYYFPTKNHLLHEIAARLSASNRQILEGQKGEGLCGFLAMNKLLYQNQYQYRAYFVSLPLWIQQDEAFAKNYREMHESRRAAFTAEFETLVAGGYLLPLSGQQLRPMLEAISATNRLWITEATIDGLIQNEELAIGTHLARLAGLLSFIATDKGRADIERFTVGL